MTIRPMLAGAAFAMLLGAGTSEASGPSTRPAQKAVPLPVATTCSDEAAGQPPLVRQGELTPTHRSGQAAAR